MTNSENPSIPNTNGRVLKEVGFIYTMQVPRPGLEEWVVAGLDDNHQAVEIARFRVSRHAPRELHLVLATAWAVSMFGPTAEVMRIRYQDSDEVPLSEDAETRARCFVVAISPDQDLPAWISALVHSAGSDIHLDH